MIYFALGKLSKLKSGENLENGPNRGGVVKFFKKSQVSVGKVQNCDKTQKVNCSLSSPLLEKSLPQASWKLGGEVQSSLYLLVDYCGQ